LIPVKDEGGIKETKKRARGQSDREDVPAQTPERKAGREWAFSSNDLNNDDEVFDQPEKLEKPRAEDEESNNGHLQK